MCIYAVSVYTTYVCRYVYCSIYMHIFLTKNTEKIRWGSGSVHSRHF